MIQAEELTEVQFWDDYWHNCRLPNTVDLTLSFERCLANALQANLKVAKDSVDVLEIGCAPGKWLAYMASEFGFTPHGIEYSHAGMEATMKNFQMLGLNSGAIISGDFFQLAPDRQFDVVMSFGFIEHFTDVDNVVDLHLKWLKPGGTLILGVPNFCGINKAIQKILDNDILLKHNLDIMNLRYFRDLAVKFHLETVFMGYIGSFEPCLPIGSKEPPNRLQFMVNVFIMLAKKVRKLRLFDKINHHSFSSYILAIYRKPNAIL